MKICRDKGWGKKSEKLAGKKSGKYYERTNIIAGYVNHKSIAQCYLMVRVILSYLRLGLSNF